MPYTYSIQKVAPNIADGFLWSVKEEFGSPMSKIEVRFFGNTPQFVSILHLADGRKYATEGLSEYLSEEDYEELGFDLDKYHHVSDSIGGLVAWNNWLCSDANLEDFRITDAKLAELRKTFNQHTLTIVP